MNKSVALHSRGQTSVRTVVINFTGSQTPLGRGYLCEPPVWLLLSLAKLIVNRATSQEIMTRHAALPPTARLKFPRIRVRKKM